MAFGLEVRNSHGTVLIDDTYRNLAVASSGSYPAQFPPVTDLTAIAAPDFAHTSFNWWCFGPPGQGGGWGLQVFNASGQVTFDSSHKYARVVDVYADVPAAGAGMVTKNYPTGRTYAAITSLIFYSVWETRGSGVGEEYRVLDYRLRTRINGGQVQTMWHETVAIDWQPSPGAVPTFPIPTYDTRVIVLDVTGY